MRYTAKVSKATIVGRIDNLVTRNLFVVVAVAAIDCIWSPTLFPMFPKDTERTTLKTETYSAVESKGR